jgi:ribose-phosphate pyrophosphokinase
LLNKAQAKHINFDLLQNVMKEIGFDKDIDYVVFPDATANKRYGNVKIPNQLTGIKHRNFETGKIESLELAGKIKGKGFKALLIDDLSSYGGTFLMTAEKLKELGASEIYLLVGHCEDSIFEGNVFKTDLINKVFTTNSILTKQSDWINAKYKDRIKIYDIEGLI